MTSMKIAYQAAEPAKNEPTLFAGLRAFVQRLVFGRLRLKRRDGALQVTWDETLFAPQEKPRAKTREPVSDRKASPADFSDSLVLMRLELSIALNARPNNREVLRHLVFFESALAKQGLRALDDTPLKTLRKAHDQLQLLADPVASRDLTDLVCRMAKAILRRTADVDALLDADISRPGTLEVSEGRLSDFVMLADEVILDVAPAKTALGSGAGASRFVRRQHRCYVAFSRIRLGTTMELLLPINSRHRGAILGHLLKKDADDRLSRFSGLADDADVARYVDGIGFGRDIVLGALDCERLVIVAQGAVYIERCDLATEIGISVNAAARKGGLGKRLMLAAMAQARRPCRARLRDVPQRQLRDGRAGSQHRRPH